MAEQHRATAGEWASVRVLADDNLTYSCILELRDRIKALEAAQHAHVDLSHLSDAEREKILKQLANPGRFEVLEVAQPAKPNHPEIPDSSLVEQVEDVILRSGNEPGFRAEARAAIREVAAWMGEQIRYGVSLAWVVERLEEEAER